jgi:AcrR family transcriptional regulator
MTESSGAAAARDNEQRYRIIATAERLFRQFGFQKTTVADIARELRMSPANIYRFFSAKSEINAAVARLLMGEVETAAEAIAAGPGAAAERLRRLVVSSQAMNMERYVVDRKIHDMVEAAIQENWPTIDEHIQRIEAIFESVIRSGMEAGEFRRADPGLAAKLVCCACIRYCHPRLMVEFADNPEPTSDQMVDFCLAALREGL